MVGRLFMASFLSPQTDEDPTNRGRRRIIHVNRSPTAASPEPFVVSLHSLNLSVSVFFNHTHQPRMRFRPLPGVFNSTQIIAVSHGTAHGRNTSDSYRVVRAAMKHPCQQYSARRDDHRPAATSHSPRTATVNLLAILVHLA